MPSKLSIEDCYKTAEAKGGRCLSTVYKNCTTKMEWECKEKHTWFAKYNNIRLGKQTWCPHCNNKTKGQKIKHSIEKCQETAQEKGGKCLSTAYKDAHLKLEWECEKNHRWFAKYNDVKNNNSWCLECSGKMKLTIEHCHKIAEEKSGKCLSLTYKNGKSKLLWQCEKGHEWKATYNSVKQRTWCLICSGNEKNTLEECKTVAENRGGKCLSLTYENNQTKMEWQCENGHQWEAKYNNIKKGTWCLICSGSAKLTLEECKTVAESRGGKCLSEVYINSQTKMEWECENGHRWKTRFDKIKNEGCWCPNCKYKSERACREILESLFGVKFPKERPKFLKGLELDGYCQELKLAFEYNGEQHYKHIPHFHRDGQTLENQQERDRAKYRRCKRNNVNLIIIPYKFNYKDKEQLETFILDELATHGY